MKKEFDFDKVGKQMPYKVPADFFDNITAQTLQEAKRREQPAPAKPAFNWAKLAVAASVALLLAAFGFWMYNGQQHNKLGTIADNTPVLDNATSVPTEEGAGTEATTATAEAPLAAAELPKADTSMKPVVKTPAGALAAIDKKETLDDVLATVSDEELLLLAAIAESDLYVYEQTFD